MRLGKKIGWRLEALAYDVVGLVLKLFPFGGISAFGGWLLRLIGPLTSKHKIAKTGLEIAFPEKSEGEIAQILKEQWDNTRVRKQRERYGTKFLVQKSTHKGGRELLEALKNGESIALLNDQKFNTGVSVPFFHEEAMTAQGATRLALKTGRPLLPMAVTRDGSNFTVTFYEPIELDTSGDRETNVLNGVKQVTGFIEDRIREAPAQWFWVHRRWPKELYRKQ